LKLKFFELRDKATFIPIFAFRAIADDNQQNAWLLIRAGFGFHSNLVIVGKLECSGVSQNCTYDAYAWGGRTYPVAHKYIEEHFDELESGAVLDVEFILGETSKPKVSEAEGQL
jgi:hypothetical protein